MKKVISKEKINEIKRQNRLIKTEQQIELCKLFSKIGDEEYKRFSLLRGK